MNGTRYDSIQGLRAIAAVMVVLFHAGSISLIDGSGHFPFEWAKTGADVFFVISGFVMWVSTCDRDLTPREFYRHRIDRIVPLYWTLTSVMLAIGLIAPDLLRSAKLEGAHIVASYLFVAWPSPIVGAEGQAWPLLVVGWSLNQEMLFCLVFGATLLLPARRRVAATLAALSALTLAGLVLRPTDPVARFYLSWHAVEFAAGIALGAVTTGRKLRLSAPAAAALAGLGFALLMRSHHVFEPGAGRDAFVAFAAVLVTAGAVGVERSGHLPGSKAVATIGEASYSLYLTHPFLLSALASGFGRLHLDDDPVARWGFVAAAVSGSLLLALVVFHRIERPMTRAVSRWRRADAASTRRPVGIDPAREG